MMIHAHKWCTSHFVFIGPVCGIKYNHVSKEIVVFYHYAILPKKLVRLAFSSNSKANLIMPCYRAYTISIYWNWIIALQPTWVTFLRYDLVSMYSSFLLTMFLLVPFFEQQYLFVVMPLLSALVHFESLWIPNPTLHP